MRKWLIILMAIQVLGIVTVAASLARLKPEVELTTRLGVGMPEADALAVCANICGPPIGRVADEAGFEVEPFVAYERPSRMIGDHAVVFRLKRKLVYVFVDDKGIVECVFWARRQKEMKV